MVQGIERREKRYVEVVLDVSTWGAITPLAIYWEDGRCFCIDKVVEQRYAASMKVGGHGIRYTVLINGQARHLWNDDKGWYVEYVVPDVDPALH